MATARSSMPPPARGRAMPQVPWEAVCAAGGSLPCTGQRTSTSDAPDATGDVFVAGVSTPAKPIGNDLMSIASTAA